MRHILGITILFPSPCSQMYPRSIASLTVSGHDWQLLAKSIPADNRCSRPPCPSGTTASPPPPASSSPHTSAEPPCLPPPSPRPRSFRRCVTTMDAAMRWAWAWRPPPPASHGAPRPPPRGGRGAGRAVDAGRADRGGARVRVRRGGPARAVAVDPQGRRAARPLRRCRPSPPAAPGPGRASRPRSEPGIRDVHFGTFGESRHSLQPEVLCAPARAGGARAGMSGVIPCRAPSPPSS